MTRKQFDLLTHLEGAKEKLTQRGLAASLGVSLGTVNKTEAFLHENGWIDSKRRVTDKGYAALEPYRAKRAIFLAAGMGSRLVPVTLNTPKPLVRVHGVRIIDTVIDAVIEAGIEEIYIVRGYLAEQFDQLLYKYPQIKFIENPIYNETNNISSAMCARYLLKNAYIMEADLLINNKSIIRKYNYTSNCLGVPVEVTDDWCLLSKNGVVTELVQGGRDCHHLFTIYYWNSEDGARLPAHLEKLYNSPGGKERFWDLAPMTYYNKDYHVEIVECSFDDISEIDTYRELKAIDHTYI